MVSPMPSCSSDAKRGGGGDDAFRAHAGFGQSQMQRIIAARGQRAVDIDQVLHAADFGAEDDLVVAQAVLLRQLRPSSARSPPWLPS